MEKTVWNPIPRPPDIHNLKSDDYRKGQTNPAPVNLAEGTNNETIAKLKDVNKKLRKQVHTTQKTKCLMALNMLEKTWKQLEDMYGGHGGNKQFMRTYMDKFVCLYMPAELNSNEKKKVEENFYNWLNGNAKDASDEYKQWGWDIELTEADKKQLTDNQAAYKNARGMDKYQWWRKENRNFFEPPNTFGQEDADYTADEKKNLKEYKAFMKTRDNRRRAAWKHAVIRETPPENGLITATPNPYVLDFAL